MKRCQIFVKTLALFSCIILALGGCGKEKQSDSVQGTGGKTESDTEELMAYKDIRYLPEFTDTSERWNGFASTGLGFRDDILYVVKRDFRNYNVSGGQLIAYRPDTKEETLLLDEEELKGQIMAAAPLNGGSAMALLNLLDGGYVLHKVDSEGKEIFTKEFQNIPITSEATRYDFITDNQDRGYLRTYNEIILFDEKGEIAGNIDVKGKGINKIVCGGDGKVYIYEYMVNQLIPIDFETKSLGTGYTVPIPSLRAVAATEKADFIICDNTTVYEYNCGEGTLTPLFDLQDSLIPDAFDIHVMGEMKDGRILVFSVDSDRESTEVALLTATPLAEYPVKEEVTMGLISPSQNLLDSITAFNRQNNEVAVSVINYSIGGRSYQEAREALRFDFSIGKGPDLCDLGELTELESLYESGCFADLSAYLGEGRTYKREDFIPQALGIYSWQDQVMGIPKYFYLRTLVGNSDIVGTSMGWDMEDVKKVIDGHRDALIFDVAYSSYMFNVCARNMLGEFVDLDRKKADFESPEYIAFLNFLKDLPDNFTEKEDSECYSSGDSWLKEGRALLSVRDIFEVTELQKLDSVFRGNYTCVGFPSPDKTPDCIIGTFSAYAISSVSEKKGAWEFIEWDLSSQGQEKGFEEYDHRLRGGFPTRTDVFEEELREAVEGGGWRQEQEEQWGSAVAGYKKTTSKEAELLRALIESASPDKKEEQTILDIMDEEIAYLYDGSKTAEEVAKVTQNRVQLYLDE